MDTLMVFFIQICLIYLVWNYQLYVDPKHSLYTAHDDLNILYIRFIASILMHLRVTNDLINGLMMMKYAINHFDNFTNIHIAFLVSFVHTIITLVSEITVIMVLCSFTNIVKVVMGYVSLS